MRSIAVLLIVLASLVLAGVLAGRPAQSDTPSGAQPIGERVVLHGHVLSATGLSILLRTDDGRTIFVNMAQIPPSFVPFLPEGRRVVVLGTYAVSPTTFNAQAIEPGS